MTLITRTETWFAYAQGPIMNKAQFSSCVCILKVKIRSVVLLSISVGTKKTALKMASCR